LHFSRLRLSGFKSFVDPTDFRIEPGLTGVVGPNGCGKSNLLEGLRWVMGASSAKALRGEGMDDVIFSGSADRPARDHAEVTLTIDNADLDAPEDVNFAPVLEIGRRIDRGEGSRYKINGRDVRARDVQLVFADASSGANSPALVRQGQISELIAARPQNRRRILEEAAGVSGLHSRRHDAELRVRAADANLTRLDDVMGEADGTLNRLQREARQSERYRRLSAEIRSLQGALVHARWAEAAEILERAEAEAGDAEATAEATARYAAQAMAMVLEAEARIRPLREEETAAAANLHRISIDRDRLDRAAESAKSESDRLVQEIARITADAAREAEISGDSGRTLSRLDGEISRLSVQIARTPRHLPSLEAAAVDAEARRSAAEREVEALAAEIAAAEVHARAAEAGLEQARSLLARTLRALAQAQGERESAGPPSAPEMALAEDALVRAKLRLTEAREVLEAAEQALASAVEEEHETRGSARTGEDDLGRLMAEAQGLASAAARSAPTEYGVVVDQLAAPNGLEAALAAALGDDLEASLDKRAARFWGGRDVFPPKWPLAVSPLGAVISVPAELAAAVAFVGVTDRDTGPKIQSLLPPGAKLVSVEGDLWRWDGFTSRAEAPRPAQIRLEQKARLVAIERQVEALVPRVSQAKRRYTEAAEKLARAQGAARLARSGPPAADVHLAQAREKVEQLVRDGARRESRAQSLDETIARFEVERDEAAASLAAAQTQLTGFAAPAEKMALLATARVTAVKARETAAAARAALDLEIHERETRTQRLDASRHDHAEWAQRAAAASMRQAHLAEARTVAADRLAKARAAPVRIEGQRMALLDEVAAAEARKSLSSDALSLAEAERADADRRSRAADASAADAREVRATLTARSQGARERVAQYAAAAEAAGLSPQESRRRLAQNAVAVAPVDMEHRLEALEREREGLGAVNLRAEEEAQELAMRLQLMRSERADLAGALARLRQGLLELNAEGRRRLVAAFDVVNDHFRTLFKTLFEGGQAELRLVEAEDPLEAGLEIFACPPGKRMAVMSLMSGGEQALTAVALIFAVFLANPAPVCFLDEVDAPLDDANVERFCDLLRAMCARTSTRFVAITHNALTMSRMDRLFGVTMPQRGVSQLVSVDLRQAESLAAQ